MAVTKQSVFRGNGPTWYSAAFQFARAETCVEAKKRAYYACTARFSGCSVAAWTNSGCIGTASQAPRRGDGYGFAIDNDLVVAVGKAVEKCRAAGNAFCGRDYSECVRFPPEPAKD